MNTKNFLADIFPEPPKVENTYEKIVMIAKRARQIEKHRSADFEADLSKLGIQESYTDQIINTEGWQEVLSKTYEVKKDAIACAEAELEEGGLIQTVRTPE